MTRKSLLILLIGLLGIPAGVGAFTFVYAKGFSYLSTDPRACVTCHVMNEQYDAWLKSGMETGLDEGYAKLDRMVADGTL